MGNQSVKPKKHLGQHFLKDLSLSKKIADSLTHHQHYTQAIEIGPGTGALSQYLLKNPAFYTYLFEIDAESVAYLKMHFQLEENQLIEGDFLRYPLQTILTVPTAIVGNFPYNISSQIFFKVFEFRNQIPEVVGMIQKEVAQRIVAKPGGKVSGILSILLQTFYDIEYLFTVPPSVFNPPPKVDSAVIRLKRNLRDTLECDEKLFVRIVKAGFNQRRKTLRNALKSLQIKADMSAEVFSKRAEQLGVEDFISITKYIENE